jgi:hypothetical protein
MPAYRVWSPEFKPQCCPPAPKRSQVKTNLWYIYTSGCFTWNINILPASFEWLYCSHFVCVPQFCNQLWASVNQPYMEVSTGDSSPVEGTYQPSGTTEGFQRMCHPACIGRATGVKCFLWTDRKLRLCEVYSPSLDTSLPLQASLFFSRNLAFRVPGPSILRQWHHTAAYEVAVYA